MSRTAISAEHVEAMRRAFDDSFAKAPELRQDETTALLAIGVGDRRYALPLGDIVALHVDRRLVPVPTPPPFLLGIAGIRGRVVPVYDLAALLGTSRATRAPRWLVVCRSAEPFAVAFDRFEGFLELPAAALRSVPAGTGDAHVRAIASQREEARAVIDVAAVAGALGADIRGIS